MIARRQLEQSRVYEAFGLTWLELTVERVAGVSKKTGEVRHRLHATRYVVQRGEGVVRLVTEKNDPETGKPVVYEVRPGGCSCPDHRYGGFGIVCKHRAGCRENNLFDTPEGDNRADRPPGDSRRAG